jgi:succinoglycan biosynthesis protein ExoH
MVIGIVVLHLPPSQPLSELSGSLLDFVKAFFSQGVFRATVPVLTAISGFLVFCSGLHLKPRKLFKKKCSSILFPLLLWNIPFAIFVFAVQKYELLSHSFSANLYPVDTLAWINALTGAMGKPVNYPLNFLRDLFVVSLLSPIMWITLKNIPYIGLTIVLVIYFFNLDGSLVLRNSMLVSFYIGALAACQRWELTYLDRYSSLLFTLFIALCLAIVFFKWENIEIFRLISPLLVWPSMSLVVNSKAGDVLYNHSKSSFFTFLSHGPIILVIWLIFNKVAEGVPYFVYWFATPAITVLLTAWLSNIFKKRMPLISSFALGGR